MSDWHALDLGHGRRTLIEASAGTGKTWTISVLYLRLILELGFTPRQIIVTTFTNAAAEELRERLRSRLLWALHRLLSGDWQCAGDASDDAAWLAARWQAMLPETQDLPRLQVALSELDLAPIGTLHGLCRRILSEHPFAAGAVLRFGEVVDGEACLKLLVDDLWRICQQSAGEPALVRAFATLGVALSRRSIATLLRQLLRPGVDLAREALAPLPVEHAATLARWAAQGGVIDSRRTAAATACARLAAWLENQTGAPSNVPGLLADLRKLPAALLKASREDPAVRGVLEFVDAQCLPRLERLLIHAAASIADQAARMLDERLAAAGSLRFEDLLLRVQRALECEAAPRPLAQMLYQRWPVALVDEFQDTDGVQFEILDRIYRDADGALRGHLVMIGDPKQAIYRFRGGDIHAYLRARQHAQQTLALDVNHRSSQPLVAAVNEFYALCGDLLGADAERSAIRYQAVTPSNRRDAEPYLIDGMPCGQPLTIHYQSCPAASVPERRAEALDHCARQIVALLADDRHRIGSRPLLPSDIAVLLPRHSDVDELCQRLRRRGVPCVTSSRGSVFATDVARELQLILYAVVHCNERSAVNAALATRLLGVDFRQLQALEADLQAWQAHSRRFHEWSARWQAEGVQALISGLVEVIAPRLLHSGQGERDITDLRHLGELLQAQSARSAGQEALLAWFAQQRAAAASGDEAVGEAQQLRIESDARRVRLMTLHASKGLEFPIVFLPLMWDHGSRRPDPCVLLTDPSTGRWRLGFDEAAQQLDQIEQQDERFRVLYVALTRAIYACHLFALPPDRPATAGANAKPAQGTARSALDVMLTRLHGRPPASAHIRWIDGWTVDGPERIDRTGGDDAGVRVARPLPDRPDAPVPARHSFTTLAHIAVAQALDSAATDESPRGTAAGPSTSALPEAHPLLTELAGTRGTEFGNAIHAMFERRACGQTFAAQRALIQQCLAEYGVVVRGMTTDALVERLVARLQAVLDLPLEPEPGASTCLSDIGEPDLRAEMAFHFVLDDVDLRALRHACERHGEPGLVPFGERRLAGLMLGKIDLVFRLGGRYHVLDYKGNYLGDDLAEYCGERLLAHMDAAHYRFQALLYTLAVHRFLRRRLDGYRIARDLGACHYLFVRAIGLREGAGHWRHRFPDELIMAVDEVFGGSNEGMNA